MEDVMIEEQTSKGSDGISASQMGLRSQRARGFDREFAQADTAGPDRKHRQRRRRGGAAATPAVATAKPPGTPAVASHSAPAQESAQSPAAPLTPPIPFKPPRQRPVRTRPRNRRPRFKPGRSGF